MKILLIEDDAADATFFRHLLKGEPDVEVTVETTLEAGTARCESDDFDIVVLDLTLPDSVGLDTVHAFLEGVRSAPALVLLTGLDDQDLALRAVKAGAQDFIVKGGVDAAALVKTLRHSLERHRMAEELMAANERVRYLATHCPLTELPNRYLFMDRLENALANEARTGVGLAVLFLDLNGFKPINDTYGHEAGDEVLRIVSSRLQQAVRTSDTVARLGGDEFTILLTAVTDPVAIEGIVEKISAMIAEPIQLADSTVVVRLAIGVAIHPADGRTSQAMLRHADAAMYAAKSKGESHRFWSDGLNVGVRRRQDESADLAAAIEADELEPMFQPQVDVRSGEIVGCVTRVRWNRPGSGMLLPEAFLPLAERAGLIGSLEARILGRAAAVQAGLIERGIRRGPMAVKVSSVQLTTGAFLESALEILAGQGLAPCEITVELSERALFGETRRVDAPLADLGEAGIGIAIGEFGAGLSSISRLATLPVDQLKLDGELVRSAPSDEAAARATRALIDAARALGLEVIAEGVERAEDRAFLTRHGCFVMHGELGSPLRTEAEIETLMRAGAIADDSP